MRQARLFLYPLVLCLITPAMARTEPHPGSPLRCPTGSIASIAIDNHSIFDTSDPELSGHLRLAYRLANSLHARTRASVIRRDLLFRVGDCFDPTLIAESERLLRDNQFLASATISHSQRADGDYDLTVTTRDEWSTRIDIRASLGDGPLFKGASIRESNFLGTGQTVELFYIDYKANRDYGVGYHNHQLGGSHWHLGGTFGRTRNGPMILQSLALPFREESGRWAAREEFRQLDRNFDYLVDDAGAERHLLLPTRLRAFDLAVIRRLGPPGGQQLTVGAALGYTRIYFPGGHESLRLVEGDDFDDAAPADPTLLESIRPQTTELHTVRSMILLGQRRIRWVKRIGFDTLRGEQDIRLGTETSVAIGRSLLTPSGPHHIFTALDLYAGTGSENLLLVGRVRGDAQRALQGGEIGWYDIFGEAEALAYWKPAPDGRHTFVLRATATGGWETTTPFQLILGGDLGVRGYPDHRFPGGRRVVFSLEDRLVLDGPLRNVTDLGLTAFIDLGRIWPGDAPFGTDSGWRASAGIGLRNAFPTGGRRTYRIDLAMPIRPHTTWKDLRLILSVGELIGVTPSVRRLRIEELQRFTSRNPFYFPD